jgi:hypothetical protein
LTDCKLECLTNFWVHVHPFFEVWLLPCVRRQVRNGLIYCGRRSCINILSQLCCRGFGIVSLSSSECSVVSCLVRVAYLVSRHESESVRSCTSSDQPFLVQMRVQLSKRAHAVRVSGGPCFTWAAVEDRCDHLTHGLCWQLKESNGLVAM